MKTFLATLKAIAATTAAIAAADVAGLVHLLPQETAKTLAIGLSACAAVAHVFDAIVKALESKNFP